MKKNHALIFLRPDDPPGGLQDFVHPGPAVGVVEARPVLGVVVAAQHFLRHCVCLSTFGRRIFPKGYCLIHRKVEICLGKMQKIKRLL